MRKVLVLALFLLMAVTVLTSCDPNVLGHNMINLVYQRELRIREERVEKIMSAIKAEDREALKALFSQRALDEAYDIDSEIDFLFDFIQGDIESWEASSSRGGAKLTGGGRTLELSLIHHIYINTDADDYRLGVSDRAIDVYNPDYEGVSSMAIRRLSEPEKRFPQNYSGFGIQFAVLPEEPEAVYSELGWFPAVALTFDGNGGTPLSHMLMSRIPFTSLDTMSLEPTRDNYTFVGWFTTPAEQGGVQFMEDSLVPTVNMTFWARWVERQED